MRPTVILTRSDSDSARIRGRLAAAHFSPLVLPLLKIEPLPAASLPDLPPLNAQDAVIYISANAVKHGLPHIRAVATSRPRAFAVGRRTSALLQTQGVMATSPLREDSEGLLALPELGDVSGSRVVIVKGVAGRTLIADTLRDRGAEVIEFSCYRRHYLPLDKSMLARDIAPKVPLVWVANSGGVVEHLGRELVAHGFGVLREEALLVPSVRVGLLASKQGWSRVLPAADASDTAALDLLTQTYG